MTHIVDSGWNLSHPEKWSRKKVLDKKARSIIMNVVHIEVME